MSEPTPHQTRARDFTSNSRHYRWTLWRSAVLVLIGTPLFIWGLYLVVNDLPETSVRRAQIVLSGAPTTVGAIAITFGGYGLVTGILGAMRRGQDAIDLRLGDAGATVRGGHVIPWRSIARVESVQYINRAKVRLLWNDVALNRSLVLHLKERVQVPGATSIKGKPVVRIGLLRYPIEPYGRLYNEVVADFRSRRIQVTETRTHRQA